LWIPVLLHVLLPLAGLPPVSRWCDDRQLSWVNYAPCITYRSVQLIGPLRHVYYLMRFNRFCSVSSQFRIRKESRDLSLEWNVSTAGIPTLRNINLLLRYWRVCVLFRDVMLESRVVQHSENVNHIHCFGGFCV
jgi:hypothetical protein